jgi:hypothetical protein
MIKRQKRWIYSPPNPPKPKVPEDLMAEVEIRATELVETVLKPQHLKPPPEDERFNYIVDIYTKWYRNYFYFCAKYACPGPNALSPFFETKFARMEYVGGKSRFNLSFMRYTGEWIALHRNLSLEECLAAIRDEPHFYP